MRRSELFQKKRLTKTITLFVILLLLTVLLISTVGLKLLLNYSVFVADLFSKKSASPLNKTVDIYGSINIDNIPIATNSALIIVSGSVINYDKIQFFLNNKKVKEIDSVSSDTFSEEIGDLENGENKVFIKALSADGKSSKKTDTFTVLFKEEKPKLEISEPKEGDKTSQQEVIIKGSTDKEVFVKINDLPITVDAKGYFQTSYRLKEGDNSINIEAIDIAGNVETKTLTIVYQKEE